LKLPRQALEIIQAQPKGDGDLVFGRFVNFGRCKDRLNKACGVNEWTLHDLRRTARSLMSRAGVSSEHAERVLGHAIRGVEGVYDRHAYSNEKAHALRSLADLVERIVRGPSDNVVELHTDAAASS
jgi:integrase